MQKIVAIILIMMAMTGAAWAQTTADVVEAVKGTVVSIDANIITYSGVTGMGTLELSRTSQLLTNRLTGFVYTPNGYIITDSEGITDTTLLMITFDDGTELEGEVVHVDSNYGIGVIKVEPEEGMELQSVKINRVRYSPEEDQYPYDQGEPVLTIGYSGGFGGTVTSGIISGIRNFRNRSQILVPHVIQTDTVINAGNEGCPLINLKGELIGMHEMRAGDMQNTAFFTPSWLLCRIADEIIEQYEAGEDIEVWHPWLGIKPYAGSASPITGRIREVDPQLKMYMDIPDQYWDAGILLDRVWLESPAREYGLLDRDMLLDVMVLGNVYDISGRVLAEEQVKYPETLLTSIEQLELLVSTAEEGDLFVFGVLRKQNYFKVEVEIGQHPGAFSFTSTAALALERSEEYF